MGIVDTAELLGVAAAAKLNPSRRAELGQYMTPAAIGRFMAGLFSDLSGAVRVLDPGAGAGLLTAALVERLCAGAVKPDAVSLAGCEIEPALLAPLSNIWQESAAELQAARIPASRSIHPEDFLLNRIADRQSDFSGKGFTHIIMNPPYRKISAVSAHRAALRRAGLETSNLYAGFMYLAAQQLQSGGEMVAIVPRSFCNGPYFKAFRQQFFAVMGLRQIHLFERRDALFRGDGVLQENIILHAVKDKPPAQVKITTSQGDGIANSRAMRMVDYSAVIHSDDPDKFVHIPAQYGDRDIAAQLAGLPAAPTDLGFTVSTGPVVDFRLREYLCDRPEPGTAPLLYPAHFPAGRLEWPRAMKKPNAIRVTEQSRRWLWGNRGHFVVTRRFSAKEERRRIVAAVYPGSLLGELVGFENHLNVYHADKQGFAPDLAAGLSLYLNSSLVDRYFRQFNGHTQVNAADLRVLPYPQREALERMGWQAGGAILSQQEIDGLVAGELGI